MFTVASRIRGFSDFMARNREFRQTYGLTSGSRIGWQLRAAERRTPADTHVRIDVPGLCQPVWLRAQSVDIAVFRQIFGGQPFQFDADWCPEFIIDAGAHIGLSSIWLANRFPDAQIVSLEVDEDNFQLLLKNTKDYPRIVPVRKGLWCEAARLQITNANAANWSFRVSQTTAGTIEGITVSDILEEFGRQQVDLVKMDIEGAERDVFSRGYDGWIDRVQVIAVELHDRHRPGCTDAVMRATSGRDFSVARSGEYTLLNRRSAPVIESV